MSAYVTLVTPMLCEECLVSAIEDLGIPRAQLVRAEQPIALRGWQGGLTANIVLPKEVTGDRFNDIGFLRKPTGYVAILSNDYAGFGQDWLSRLSARYQVHWNAKEQRLAEEERRRVEDERQKVVEAQRQVVLERAKQMGYQVKETREGTKIRLVLVKRTY
jgi:hypothetical protein